VGEPGSAVTVIDSSFAGSVQAKLKAMFPATEFSGALLWYGEVPGDRSGPKKGYVQHVGPGDRGDIGATPGLRVPAPRPVVEPHPVRRRRAAVARSRSGSSPGLGGHRPGRRVGSVPGPRVRDAVRQACQDAVADHAREVAASGGAGTGVDGIRLFQDNVRNWLSGAPMSPTLRELLDSFVKRPG
jgi:hypothetical protein